MRTRYRLYRACGFSRMQSAANMVDVLPVVLLIAMVLLVLGRAS